MNICDDYEEGDMMISIIINFNGQKSQNFQKKFIF